ncbi:MAG: hypothetical protein RXR41_04985, partial [Candidatus Marsarchaeota archaeon]
HHNSEATAGSPGHQPQVLYVSALLFGAMIYVLVHHSWEPNKEKDAQKFFETVKGAVSAGKLPSGFKMIGAYMTKGEAYCVWEVPSTKALTDFAGQLKPPTKVEVKEVSKYI